MADVSSPSLKILYPEWEREFQAALSEREPGKLRERVTAAETAIFNRAQALLQRADADAERQAVVDALLACVFSRAPFPRGRLNMQSKLNGSKKRLKNVSRVSFRDPGTHDEVARLRHCDLPPFVVPISM